MKNLFLAAFLLFSMAACIEEGDYITVLAPSGDDPSSTSELRLSFEGAGDVSTRSILGDGVDSKLSGAVVGVYDSVSGILDSEWEVPDFSSPLVMRLPSSGVFDIYVLGNLWYIGLSGEKVRLSFPEKEGDVTSMVYMLDGGHVPEGRSETFAEAADYGIPVVGTVKGVSMLDTQSVSMQLKRLFAKVTLTIDHSGLDGGKNPDFFKNAELYLRQANVRLTPFAPDSRSVSSGDVVEKSDYDPAMTNGHSLTYTFYAPENRHGAFPTYVEFKGEVDPSAGGYGGSVCYRFHIGSGEDGDYDLEGNQNYRVKLGFKAGSLFEPQWEVSTGDDWSDRRKLCLAADSAGASRLSSSSVIAVRKSRPATCWLYFNRQGTGPNEASLLTACNGSFEPSDLTGAAWWCEAPDLARHGIALDVSGSRLTFRVSDPSKFVPGSRIPVRIHLYPGDIVSEVTLTAYEDIAVSVSGGLSLTEDFYVGMSRTVRVSGLAGSRVYYWNAYGIDRLTLKASTSPGADWIHNSRSSAQSMPAGEELKLCAYSVSYGHQFLLYMASDDSFNDGSVIYNTDVVVDVPKTDIPVERVYVPFDGRGVEVPFDYLDNEGKVIGKDRFDAEIYSQIMRPEINWPTGDEVTLPDWIGGDGPEIYLKNYYSDGTFIGDLTTRLSGFLGPLSFGPSDPSLAYGTALVMVYVRAPVWYAAFPTFFSEYFNTRGASDISAKADVLVYDGSQFTTEFSGNITEGISLNAGKAEGDHHVIEWKFSDAGRIPDGNAPVGPQTVSLVFTNIRSGETYRLSSTFDVNHHITLRPLVLFTLNSTYAEVVATTAKNAWMLGRYCARESGVPRIASFLGLSGSSFPRYVTMKYSSATSRRKTATAVYRGSCSMTGRYQYQDFNTSAYGKGYKWTSARIREFTSSGASALTYLGFCGPAPDYAPLAVPLAASYVGGSPYIYLSVSNDGMGGLTLP